MARPIGKVTLRSGQDELFRNGYSDYVLYPLIFMPIVLRLGILWSTAGLSFSYSDAYTGAQNLAASGLNIVNQVVNVLTAISTVALIILYQKEVTKQRLRFSALTLLVFFVYSFYVGARTLFLAPLLTYVVVYSRFHRVRMNGRNVFLTLLATVFFFGVEVARSAGNGVNSVVYIISEPFIVFTNGLSFFDSGFTVPVRPELNSYLNDFIKILPNYIYSTHLDMSDWFMRQFFYDAYLSGSGRAFGLNTEAMMNYGKLSIAFQACSVAILLAWLTRIRPRTRHRKEYVEVLVILAVVSGYATVRLTTFVLLSIIGSTVIAVVGIRTSNYVFSKRFLRVEHSNLPSRAG